MTAENRNTTDNTSSTGEASQGGIPLETLDQLRVGQSAVIDDIDGDDAIAVRLMEMGLIPGESIEMLGAAPLGDPLEYRVCGYRISLRCREAQRVRLAPPVL